MTSVASRTKIYLFSASSTAPAGRAPVLKNLLLVDYPLYMSTQTKTAQGILRVVNECMLLRLRPTPHLLGFDQTQFTLNMKYIGCVVSRSLTPVRTKLVLLCCRSTKIKGVITVLAPVWPNSEWTTEVSLPGEATSTFPSVVVFCKS